jgi:hypothetical protein
MLYKKINRDIPIVGIEIGLWEGTNSKRLLDEFPNLSLIGIDPFEEYLDWSEKIDQTRISEKERITRETLAPYIENGRFTLIKKYSDKALEDLEDNKYNFVYIDGDHSYKWVKHDIEKYWEKIKEGGILCGHDRNLDGVKRALKEFSARINKNFIATEQPQQQSWYITKTNPLESIPAINCISLNESTERRSILLKEFQKYSVNNINFLISNRYDKSTDKVQGKFLNSLNEGTIGCCLSHLKMIKQWLDTTQEEYGFFCEDDLSLKTVFYWDNTWKDFIKTLPSDWECVQLLTIRKDNLTLNVRERFWDDWGATAYILKRDLAKKIIETYYYKNFFKLELPEPNSNIQPLIENLLFTQGKTYTTPLFVENIDLKSTFVDKDQDVNTETNHKSNHIVAANRVLQMWDNKKPKIVDYFIYFNEKELLELRINLLKDVVDEFIIIESNYTFSGQLKPYTCRQIIEDLNLPKEKIRLLEIDLSDEKCGQPTESDLYYNQIYNQTSTIGSRERIQRDYLLNVLNDYVNDTVFIVSDCDEIINPVNVQWVTEVVRNNLDFICKIPLVALDGRADYRLYKKENNNEVFLYDCSMFLATKQQLLVDSPNNIRGNYKLNRPITYIYQDGKRLEDLGWHFSWMGNIDRIKTKAHSYGHYGLTLENFIYKECFGDKMLSYFDNHKFYNGGLPVSGIKDTIIKDYPVEKLPQIIFSLSRVKNFLLPEQGEQEHMWLTQFATNVDKPEYNFKAGIYYFEQGHTAPAKSYFLRCAERTDDKLLAYEALIYGYLCYKEQKIRDETAKSLIMHALCLLPERPEARWLMSVFYEQKQLWMYSYYHAIQGLKYNDQNFEPLKYYKDYPGKIGLLFQKAISGYWWGKNDECKEVFLDLWNNYQLNDIYKQNVRDNLKRIGVEIS